MSAKASATVHASIKLHGPTAERRIVLMINEALRSLGWNYELERVFDNGCRHGITGHVMQYRDAANPSRSFTVYDGVPARTNTDAHPTMLHLHEYTDYTWIMLEGTEPDIIELITELNAQATAPSQVIEPFAALSRNLRRLAAV